MERKIALAGGCFWGAEKYLSSLRGVSHTEVGYANGKTECPTYEQVKHEGTGHAETVLVRYDDELMPLRTLLSLFFLIIDPVAVDRQGGDVWHQYRTGIYYTDPADEPVAREALQALQAQTEGKVAVELLPLSDFWRAEEYHQAYLDKNPAGYCHVPLAAIAWAKTVNPLTFDPAEAPQFAHFGGH